MTTVVTIEVSFSISQIRRSKFVNNWESNNSDWSVRNKFRHKQGVSK